MTFDTLAGRASGVSSGPRPRRGQPTHDPSAWRPFTVIARTPKIVLLTLAVSAALVGCGKNETPATDSAASTAAPATPAAAATEYKLDDSKLP
ncbi:MAG: peptidase, partial [Stenotrophomonas sp.]